METCKECGVQFKKHCTKQDFCTRKCKFKYQKRIDKENKDSLCQERKAKQAERQKVKPIQKSNMGISLMELYKKDSGICHICGEPTDLNDTYFNRRNKPITGASYPTIDHILPQSKGGETTWDNVRLAHKRCNSIKQDKDVYEGINHQMKYAL